MENKLVKIQPKIKRVFNLWERPQHTLSTFKYRPVFKLIKLFLIRIIFYMNSGNLRMS